SVAAEISGIVTALLEKFPREYYFFNKINKIGTHLAKQVPCQSDDCFQKNEPCFLPFQNRVVQVKQYG
ncbi:MAG: hypothetical protein AB1545_15735, partial [Thermodesulfobacteriota bacterium]